MKRTGEHRIYRQLLILSKIIVNRYEDFKIRKHDKYVIGESSKQYALFNLSLFLQLKSFPWMNLEYGKVVGPASQEAVISLWRHLVRRGLHWIISQLNGSKNQSVR